MYDYGTIGIKSKYLFIEVTPKIPTTETLKIPEIKLVLLFIIWT
jgi:hypothetical protein